LANPGLTVRAVRPRPFNLSGISAVEPIHERMRPDNSRRKDVKEAISLKALQRRLVSPDAFLPGIRNLIEKFDGLQ
jgi:hypothetical protein